MFALGRQMTVEFYDCDPAKLADAALMEKIFLDAAHLEEFHRAGDGSTHSDRVETVLVAEEVCLADSSEVIYAAV